MGGSGTSDPAFVGVSRVHFKELYDDASKDLASSTIVNRTTMSNTPALEVSDLGPPNAYAKNSPWISET